MNIEKILKENNMRVTKERVDIFDFLKTKHFFTYADIVDNFDSIARSSVFRNLNIFLDIGVIRKVDIGTDVKTYELIDKENHHEHMKCIQCNKVIDFKTDDIYNKIFEKANDLGFEIKNHCIGVTGTCNDCKK